MGTSERRANGEMVTCKDVKKRWSEYFERLLNVLNDRVTDVRCLGCKEVQSKRIKASGLK